MKILCSYIVYGFFGYSELLTDYIKGQEHVPESRENKVTTSKLHNNSCPMCNYAIIVLC